MAEVSLKDGIEPATADKRPCMFWKLPLEIRDMVYSLVYRDQRIIGVKSRQAWRFEKQDRMRANPEDFKVRSCTTKHGAILTS